MPGTALGALVADHDDVAGGDLARRSSASIAARSPSKTRAVPVKTDSSKPARLHHGALGRERALEDGEAAGLVDRPVEAADHVVVDGGRRELGEVLGHRLAGHREAVAVHQAGVEQRLHHHRDAADLVDVVHDVLAERLEVAEVRHLVADPVEVVEREVDLGLAGDREQVEHGVGRAAERHHDRDRVLERLERS